MRISGRAMAADFAAAEVRWAGARGGANHERRGQASLPGDRRGGRAGRGAWWAVGLKLLVVAASMGVNVHAEAGREEAGLKFFSEPAPPPWGRVEFCYRAPKVRAANPPILVLVPGYNGSGSQMLLGWTEFADAEGFLLIAPTFKTSPGELKSRKGYYYPDQWSGRVLEAALAEVARRERIARGKILIFGHSAGGHFAHRFALWRPARVRAFVAGAAAWWDQPRDAMADVPALILCGEDDPRITASLEYFYHGLAMGLPWVWRSYRETGHAISPAMMATARAFLGHYARNEPDDPCYGDVQTYDVATDPEQIPEAVRVRLPSREFAQIWRREK